MPSRKRKLPNSPSKENLPSKVTPLLSIKTTRKRDCPNPRGQSQSCHQCRQSIFSSKGVGEIKQGQKRIKCSSCTRYWCENCLKNRYGLDRSLLKPDSWQCPVCDKICNCSVCRRKNGKLATGILTAVVKNAGFASVSDFLENGTDDIAKCLQWKQPTQNKEKKHHDGDTTSSMAGSSLSPPSKKSKQSPPTIKNKNSPTNEPPELLKCVELNHPQYSITLEEVVGVGSSSSHDYQGCGRRLRSGRIVNYSEGSKGCGERKKSTRRKPSRIKKLSKKCSMVKKEELEASQNDEEKRRLEELRVKAMADIRDRKNEIKMEEQKLKQQKRAELMEERKREKTLLMEQKRKEMEAKLMERRKLKEQKTLEKKRHKAESKQALQEKLRKAKQLVMDARRSRKAQTMKLAINERRSVVMKDTVVLDGDSPAECISKGIPELPSLQSYRHEGIAEWCVPRLVFISEFIYSFSSILNLSCSEKKELLESLLSNSHLIHKIYVGLFEIIAENDEQLSLALTKKKGNRREVVRMVCDHLRSQSGLNGCGLLDEYDRSPEQSLVILDLLCQAVLQCDSFGDLVEDQIEKLESERKELRLKKSEVAKQMRQQLHATCSGGGSLEDIEQVKREFEEKLKEIQSKYPNSSNGFTFRGQYLGMDRYDRVYWSLHSFPGKVMIEETTEGGSQSWSVIDSIELLNEVMISLHKTGFRERLLYQNLSLFKAKFTY